MGADRREPLSACEQAHIGSGYGKPGGVQAAENARTEDEDPRSVAAPGVLVLAGHVLTCPTTRPE